jgi:predicted Zn-dependent peptidase
MAEAQSVAASIMVGVGGRYENFDVNGGVSHMLEHLLFQGTARRPTAKQISEEVDAVGGWNDAYTAHELTNYYIKLPKQHGPLALDILSDLIRNPLFNPGEVERERRVIIEEMNLIKDEPPRHLADMLGSLLWANDPIGKPLFGSEELVRRILIPDIVSYKEHFYKPNNMVVSVAGQVSHEAVVEQVSRQMGDMAAKRVSGHKSLNSELSTELVETYERDTNQVHLLLGCQAYGYDEADEVVARCLSAILGRSASSRLYLELRENLGVAYDVSSEYSVFTDTGALEIYAGVNSDKAELAIERMVAEIMRIKTEPATKSELLKAKNQLRGGLQMSLESNSNVADRLGSQLLLQGKIRPLDELLAEIDAVTVEDVCRVAETLLKPERLRLAVIGPEPRKLKLKFEELIGNNGKGKV